MEKGTPVAAKVTFQDRFAALVRGFEVVLGEYTRAGAFFQKLRDVRQELFAYAPRYQEVFAGEFGSFISQAIMASIDQDFEGVAEGIGNVAAALKTLYPNGPPMPSQGVPELPAPALSRTRSATTN